MINHQRMLQTGAALYEQPSEIGLPMAYMSSVTVGGNLKVISRKKRPNKWWYFQHLFLKLVDLKQNVG